MEEYMSEHKAQHKEFSFNSEMELAHLLNLFIQTMQNKEYLIILGTTLWYLKSQFQ
jgi:hypothetical protein